ncbi:adenine phosphoribosyltransferase [Olivibacter sp. SDN3]|uniref:adenine phosphoribosyltransferase n=1 Tax=Olivibacter sp. SDN3 TaxID=2764720 RepID=UPI001651083F|nr:adenine phosphoribosyltransferase [Olivibacter sp. SDN3]QNL52156.1 adenine phosphoribosyltransferase [Olivibacter sp. SDN3]
MIDTMLRSAIRDVADFPKPGIIFKDITPILQDAELCDQIIETFVVRLQDISFDAIAGVESRGFLFGLMLANRLGIPFIPIRKAGKLPYRTVRQSYELEYGTATIEVHADAFKTGTKVLLHDDLLATGGTIAAASQLIEKLGGNIAGYCFVISLDFLEGRKRLELFSDKLVSLVNYQ